MEDFVQHESGVVATVRDLDSGDMISVACRYLVGCDGGKSTVRKKIGAACTVRRSSSGSNPPIFARANFPRSSRRGGLALPDRNPRRCGTVFAIDGRETWLVHNYLHDEEAACDSVDRDWAIRTILGVGQEFRYEVISNEDWVGRRLIADRFRDRRVFIWATRRISGFRMPVTA
jgi:2-polyprenyl-6-methoxyphenol hydroxylase-like FAD-dependent oxidoreductase